MRCLLYWGRGLGDPILFTLDGYFWLPRGILDACAGFLFLAGGRCYSLRQFLGIDQLRDPVAAGALGARGDLRTTGILGVTRHPWYLGSLLFVWTAPGAFRVFTLLTAVVFSAYLILGSILEERKLVMIFGDEYRNYQTRVSMLLPWRFLACLFRRTP